MTEPAVARPTFYVPMFSPNFSTNMLPSPIVPSTNTSNSRKPTQEPNNRGPRQPTYSQSAIGNMVSPNIGSPSTSPEKILQKDLHLSQYLEKETIKLMIITWLVKFRIVVLSTSI